MKFTTILLVLCLCVSTAVGADRFWVTGGAGDAFSATTNWSLTTGGVGGASVPGASDVAIWDGNSPNCRVDTAVSVSGWSMTAAFANAITQNTYSVDIGNGNYAQYGGTFVGGTLVDFDLNGTGTFTLTNGTFTCSSGTNFFPNDVTMTNGAVFNDNGGLFKMDGTASRSYQLGSVTRTFNNIEIDTGDTYYGKSLHGTIDITNDIVWTSGKGFSSASGAQVSLKGDFYTFSTYPGSANNNGLFTFDGTDDQTVYVDQAFDAIPGFLCNKASGTLIFDDDTRIKGPWDRQAGTIDLQGNDIQIETAGGGAYIDDQQTAFGNLTITTANQAMNFKQHTTINGLFDISNIGQLEGSNILINADVDTHDAAVGGGARLTFQGSGNQKLYSSTGAGGVPTVVIDKATGDMTITNTISVTSTTFDFIQCTNVITTGSTVNFGSGGGHTTINCEGMEFGSVGISITGWSMYINTNMICNGNFTLTAAANIYTGNIFVRGDFIGNDTTVGGACTTTIDGTGAQSLTIKDCPNGVFTINKASGTATLAFNADIDGSGQDLVLTAGTLDLAGYDLAVDDQLNIDDIMRLHGDETITAGGAFNLDTNTSTVVFYDTNSTANVSNFPARVFNDLAFGADKAADFPTGSVEQVTIAGDLSAEAAGVVLRSDVDGVQWYLQLDGTSSLTTEVDVKDSDANAGNEVSAIGSTDSGNNENWDFGAVFRRRVILGL